MRREKSYCRVCGSGCGTLVDIENVGGEERVIRISGDPEHPLTGGYTCSKGRALPDAHHSPKRLLQPMIRTEAGAREVTWDEALDDLAGKLKGIIERHGPDAVGTFLGGGGYLDAGAYAMVRSLPAALGTSSVYSDMSVDVMSKVFVSELMAGLAGMMTRPDYEKCRFVLYVGTNPMVSHGHTSMLNSPAVRMREMRARGQVWVLDPRRTETAAKADRHIAAKPGSDYAVLAWLTRELLRNGADNEYLAEHAQDVPKLAAAVERFDLAAANRLSGVPARDLEDLLEAVRKAGRLCVETGTGISMGLQANVTQWLSWALMIVTGSLDREGGAWVNPGFLVQLDQMDFPHAPPEGWRAPGPRSRPELRALAGEFPAVAIPDEIEAGNLRAIINLSGSLVTCLPDTARTEAALRHLEVLATVEVLANATTAISTHVLPTKDQLERADIPLAVDMSYPTVASQYTAAVVAPPPGVRSYWWILCELGRRMGFDFLPRADPLHHVDDDVLRMIASQGRAEGSVARQEGYASAAPSSIGWLQRYVDRIGGWRVAPAVLVEQLDELRPTDSLVLLPRRQMHHINSRMMSGRDRPGIFVSAEEASRAGLGEGSAAVVRSRHGAVEGVIRIDPSIGPGIVTVPHGWPGAYNVNQLTSNADCDPLTGMPRFSGMPVSLHPA